jgi:hypothetical protein
MFRREGINMGYPTTERLAMYHRALEHYSKRLTSLNQNEDLKHGNKLLKDDIDDNLKLVNEVIQLISTKEGSQKAINDYRDIMCSALINYIADLESAKHGVSIELAGAKPRFIHIDREIDVAKEAKKESCDPYQDKVIPF